MSYRESIAKAVISVTCLAEVIACSERPERARPRPDLPAVQVVASPDAIPLVVVTAKEPNDTPAQATALGVGERATDVLDGPSDIDVFALRLDRSRVVRVAVSAADRDTTLTISNEAGVVIAAVDTGPAGRVEAVPNLALAPGHYFLTVRTFQKPPAKNAKVPSGGDGARDATPAPYAIEVVDIAPNNDEEREPNDIRDAAGLLPLGETRRGWIGWNKDTDWWRLDTQGLGPDNAIDLTMRDVIGMSLGIEVVGDDGRAVVTRQPQKGEHAGNVLTVRGLRLPPGRGLWARVWRVGGTRSSDADQAYDVGFQARYASDGEGGAAEVEPNDTPATATVATSSQQMGWLDIGDLDCWTWAADLTVDGAPVGMATVLPSEALGIAVERWSGGKRSDVSASGGLGQRQALAVASTEAVVICVRPVVRARRGAVAEPSYRLQLGPAGSDGASGPAEPAP